MRLGTLQLSGDWDADQAQIVALRIRGIEQAIQDLELSPHAQMYVSQDPGMALSLATSGTIYPLTGATCDLSAGFIFSEEATSSRFTCLAPGKYYVNYSVSLSVATPNRHVEVSVLKNGVWQEQAESHFDFSTASIGVTVFGSMITELQRDNYLEIGIRCPDNTVNITYEHFNSTMFKVHI